MKKLSFFILPAFLFVGCSLGNESEILFNKKASCALVGTEFGKQMEISVKTINPETVLTFTPAYSSKMDTCIINVFEATTINGQRRLIYRIHDAIKYERLFIYTWDQTTGKVGAQSDLESLEAFESKWNELI